MKNVIIVLFLVLLFNSCKKEEDSIVKTPEITIIPTALYSYTQAIQPDSTMLITFKNRSSNATSYKWYFSTGDSSIAFEPTLKLYKNGNYKVTLKAFNGIKFHSYSNSFDITTIDTAKNTNNYPRPTADFKIFYNIDSSNTVQFKNTSTGYSSVVWKFENNQTSTENNPTHTFSTTGLKSVKLIVENIYKNKDSITKLVYDVNAWYQLNFQYLIIDANPITYQYYIPSIYFSSDGIHGVSFGENFTETPTKITDNFTMQFNNANTPRSRINYYTKSYSTIYKRYPLVYPIDIQPILNEVVGEYTFYDRSTYSSTSGDSIIYNDTTLTINLIGGGLIELKDTKLNHTFTGYLSSYSRNDYYEFSLMPSNIGSHYENINLQFPKNSNSVIATHRNSVGIASSYTETIYRGNK